MILPCPTCLSPDGVDYRLQDILTLTPEDIRAINPDFICASSPCRAVFSVHGMKHFHPNPRSVYPEMGLELFNHTRMLCESSGVPYVMENVSGRHRSSLEMLPIIAVLFIFGEAECHH